jgi:glutaredoxin 2
VKKLFFVTKTEKISFHFSDHLKDKNKQIEINQIIQHIHLLRQLLMENQFSKYIDYEEL